MSHETEIRHGRRGVFMLHVHRAVLVDLHLFVLAARARESLIRLQHGTGLRVVNDGRPEVFRQNIRRQMLQFVGLRAPERLTFRVQQRPGIRRTLDDHFLGHGVTMQT